MDQKVKLFKIAHNEFVCFRSIKLKSTKNFPTIKLSNRSRFLRSLWIENNQSKHHYTAIKSIYTHLHTWIVIFHRNKKQKFKIIHFSSRSYIYTRNKFKNSYFNKFYKNFNFSTPNNQLTFFSSEKNNKNTSFGKRDHVFWDFSFSFFFVSILHFAHGTFLHILNNHLSTHSLKMIVTRFRS